MQAKLVHGNPLMVDHTPSAAVAAGDIVVVGEIPHVAHLDIDANRLGALAMGGGVYQVTADAGTIEPGDKVYWDDTANKVTEAAAAGANKHFGHVLPDSDPGADGDKVLVKHDPDGSSI